VNSSPDFHSTAIGGIIVRTTRSSAEAPDAQLLNANLVVRAASSPAPNGPSERRDICNCSLWTDATSTGPITLGDMGVDYLVRPGRMFRSPRATRGREHRHLAGARLVAHGCRQTGRQRHGHLKTTR
jgi:hypothetical protein